MAWNRIVAHITQLSIVAGGYISRAGISSGTYARSHVPMKANIGLKSGLSKRSIEQIIAPGNVAITVGVAIAGNTQILASTSIAAAATILAAGLVAQPDVPRTIRIVASAATGDGTFVGASALWATFTGTDINGRTISEMVPLNSATPVDSKKAFATITQVVMPVLAGKTMSIGYGAALAFERQIQSISDLVECGRKASAATAYTVETLGTVDALEAFSTVALGDLTAAATTINLVDASGFANGAQRTMAKILGRDGSEEEIIITSRTANALTVVRGANGTTAKVWRLGELVAVRSGQTYTPGSAIVANDRFRLNYRTEVF